MSFYVIPNANGTTTFQQGGLAPEGVAAVDQATWLAAQAPAAPSAPTQAQLLAYTDSKTSATLGALRAYAADGVTISVDASSATRTDLGNLATWGLTNPTLTQPFTQTDYVVVIVTGAQYVALAPLVGAYALSVYATMAAVVTAISAGAITTFAQIDAASWPV